MFITQLQGCYVPGFIEIGEVRNKSSRRRITMPPDPEQIHSRFLALDSGELIIHQTKHNPKTGDKANNYFISVLFFFSGFL